LEIGFFDQNPIAYHDVLTNFLQASPAGAEQGAIAQFIRL
jgi:hypothetical protein